MSAGEAALLSVVIPIFQRQRLAERAIRSVLEQNVSSLEIIVVDDCSLEPFALSPEIAAPSVQLIRHEINRGAAAARNTGMAYASGTWLTFLDSDDAMLPDTLLKRLRFAQEHERHHPDRLTIYGSAFMDLHESGKPVRMRAPRAAQRASDFASGCWFCPGSCVLVKRQRFLDRVGLQTESLGRLEDLDWFLRAGLAGAELIVDPTVAAAISCGTPPSMAVVAEAASQIIRLWEDTALPAAVGRRLKAYLELELAAALFRNGNLAAAVSRLAYSLLLRPRLSLHLSPGWESSAAPRD
ncbi:glycosyltransferase family 2 protein [Mesorhizobium sp. KR1-2]|uniref:glycosyltransferase family 2 protein n=1 Tax=Mesorhizobium sp. KR1-2 TaxID=3156609 RepID=UPI0032B54643